MTRAAIALLLAAAACGASEDGALRLTWRITQGGAASTCQAVGGDTVRVTSIRKSTGSKFVDLFRCTDMAGQSEGIRPGTYTVSVELLDDGERRLSSDFSVDARILSGDPPTEIGDFDFDFPGVAAMRFSWATLINENSATCAELGAVAVTLTATPTAGGDTFVERFDCNDAAATTGPVSSGAYDVRISLLDAADHLLSYVDLDVTLAGMETKNLGHVEFPFVQRTATFRARMGASSPTCARTLLEEVRVSDLGLSQCLSYPMGGLVDEGGAEISGMSCAPQRCQDESVVQRLQRLGAGTFAVQLLGYRGTVTQPVLCYISDIKQFTITDQDVDLGVLTAVFDPPAANVAACGSP